MTDFNKYPELLEALAKPMPHKFRVQSTTQYGANLVAYIDARQAQDRLDEVFGLNWSVRYIPQKDGTFAEISVRLPDGSIVTRQDIGTESKTEGEKGEVSDSFKRAAVAFGVGRFLYNLGIQKTEVLTDGVKTVACVDKNDKYSKLLSPEDVTAFGQMLIAAEGDYKKAQAAWKAYKTGGGSKNYEQRVEANQAAMDAIEKKQQIKPVSTADLRNKANQLIDKLTKYSVPEADITRIVNALAGDLANASAGKLQQLNEYLEKFYKLHAINDVVKNDLGALKKKAMDEVKAELKEAFGSEEVPLEISSKNPGVKRSIEALNALLNSLNQRVV